MSDKVNEYRKKIKRLADNMDLACESANSHDFVITHRALAVLMVQSLGLAPTLKVFRKIRKEGGRHGLSGLTGVAGTGPDVEYLARLGISTDWGDWEVPSVNHRKPSDESEAPR